MDFSETLRESIEELCDAAGEAQERYGLESSETKNKVLFAIAEKVTEHMGDILEANANDLAKAKENGVPTVMMDRLRLTEERILSMCEGVRKVAELDDPVGKTETWTRPNGMKINRVKVPLGVVAIIFEARPNVTLDSAALCLKTGNSVVLRGGKEAIESNKAIVRAIREGLNDCGQNEALVGLVESTDRAGADILMTMRGKVDVLIPRGGKGLISRIVENATVPVIETGAGNCHLYVDEEADIEMALKIAVNAKCQRPSVCNAIETMYVHSGIAAKFLPLFADAAFENGVEIRGDAKTCVLIPSAIPATEEDFFAEYNDLILAVGVVDDEDEAIRRINRYSTGHSESIVTENTGNAEKFLREIRSACVYHNCSTRFTDGGEFGFGAEIGISTQKLHVRGPMGLDALTTEQYRITGDGLVRG